MYQSPEPKPQQRSREVQFAHYILYMLAISTVSTQDLNSCSVFQIITMLHYITFKP